MVITFGGIKGGTGKSTLAVNMAIWLSKREDADVVTLYDGDPQLTTTHFIQFRKERPNTPMGFDYAAPPQGSLTTLVKKPAPFDFILDVGGRDTTVQREAMIVSNVLVVPLALSGFDVWPLQELLELVEQAREYNPTLALFLVANRCDYRGMNTSAYRDVEQALAEMGLKFQGLVTDRVVYSRTTALGLGIFDDLPANLQDDKARAELNKLFEDILAATNETTYTY